MYKRSLLFTALALAAACKCAPSFANDAPPSDATDQHVASDIQEVGDDELSTMRGRYTAGDNTVVWFGVEMISTWKTTTGQELQSEMTLGMNFSKNANQPQVTFVPTVTITTADAPLPAVTPSTITRSIQSGGIANVGGLTQSVQLAGDNNVVSNVTSLNIQNSGSAPSSGNSSNGNNTSGASSSGASIVANSSTTSTSPSSNNVASNSSSTTGTTPSTTVDTGASTPTGRAATVGNATASSTYSNNSADVNLSISGEGNVSQWIHGGSLGQTIALTTDNQVVTNQMIVSLVTQSIASTTSQIAHNLAQSMNLSRTIGH
jgi:hypothetical protein